MAKGKAKTATAAGASAPPVPGGPAAEGIVSSPPAAPAAKPAPKPKAERKPAPKRATGDRFEIIRPRKLTFFVPKPRA